MAKPKPGDKRGWNEKTGTGYKWEVRNGRGKWIQYKNNKRHGPFKGQGGITGNVDVVGGITNRIKTAPKRWADRIKWVNKKSAEAKERRDKLKIEKAENQKILDQAKKDNNKPKEVKKEVKVDKSKKTSPKKRLTARERMRAKNVERHGQAAVDHLRAKHADFKKMKKRQMSKEDFIKKYPKSITAQQAKGLRR